MKLDIHNADTLKLINPDDIAVYLSRTGWLEKRRKGTQYSIWSFNDISREEKTIILLPFDKSYNDYLLRITEIINVLEKKENRNQLDIFRDILTISADVIKIPLESQVSIEGSIPLDHGVEKFQQVREIMLAAACATEEPKPVFPPQKTKQVLRYIDRIKLGQTEQGSYVIPIIADLSIRESIQATLSLNPFERDVGLTLVNALESMKGASEEYAITNDITCFQKTIENGVSANLCEAVVKISSNSEGQDDFVINFSWAEKIPVDEGTPNQIVLPANIMGTLDKAAEYLREFVPIKDFKIYGLVIRLEKKTESGKGTITVESSYQGQLHKISFDLPESQYHTAVRAHDRYRYISLKGTLIKDGKYFKLLTPTNLEVEWEL